MEDVDEDALDAKVARLAEASEEWVRASIDRRISLLESFLDRSAEVASDQVEETLQQQGIDPDSAAADEPWLSGPVAQIRNARLLLETLESIRDDGRPPVSVADARTRHDGRVAVDVFPDSLWDRFAYPGLNAQVWLDRSVELEDLEDSVASFYRNDDPESGVDLVLGAGNVASIPPLDTLHKLYHEGRVVLLKMNPVNDYLGEYFEEVFAPFVEAGFVEFAYGGAEVGDYLCQHDGIDAIHLTGSDRTHDAIVFGSGEEGEARKERGERRIDKPVTSELGNISPILAVPGPWNDQQIAFQAENIATQLINNAGFNCNAARVLVLPEGWDRADALVDAVASTFEEIGPRHAYYPGAAERFENFVDEADSTRILAGDEAEDGELPWAIVEDVDPNDEQHPAFKREAWCSVMATTRLGSPDPAEFLDRAVEFCNDVLWGTLNAELLVHPETRREVDDALDAAVDELEYGTVTINHWPAIGYSLGVTPWGAYPGSSYEDIQSGRGFVHNTLMFDDPHKSVVDGPFEMTPTPPWFATVDAREVARKLVEFERSPSVTTFAGVAWKLLTS